MDWFLYDNGLRHERVKCVPKKYFSHLIDKIILLRRYFSKALVILSWFLLLFLLFFWLIVYISLAFHLEIFQMTHLYCINIWKSNISWSIWSKWFGNQGNILKYFRFSRKDHAKILQTVFPSFLVCFFCLI